MNFPQRLQLVLGKLGITQVELHKKTGIAESTISRWLGEAGTVPGKGSLAKIANATGASLSWLMSGEGEMFDENLLPQNNLGDFFRLDPEVIDVEIENGKTYPVVKTYDDMRTHLHFFCIHCNCWHHHGRGGKDVPYQEGRLGPFAGHRVAHCIATNSPFRENGVILHIVGKLTAAKSYKEGKTPICPKCRSYYSAAFNACDCGYINKNRKSKSPEMAKLYQEQRETTTSPCQPLSRLASAVTPPGEQVEASSQEISEEDAIEQTRYVIRSNTVYRSALLSNIRAFYQGVKREEEMLGVNERLEQMESKHALEMSSMQEKLDRLLQAVGAAAPEKREASNSH